MNTSTSTNTVQHKPRALRFSAWAAAALSMLSMTGVASAQTNGGAQIQLAFGYECGDRFRVRNDGAAPVDVEYALQGVQQRTALHLNAGENVEIASTSNGALQLYVNGRAVATERKGNKACAVGASNQDVVVRPLGDGAVVTGGSNADVVYVAQQPQRVVYVTTPVGYSYDPWYFGFGLGYDYGYYGGYGYGYGYPRYRSGISVNIPIFRGGGFRGGTVVRGGFGGGFGHTTNGGGHFGGGRGRR
ncbi:MAG: hypothetical protein M3Y64_06575 [Gemmatimonadota bacterium]|nr:hypothetical protein [Gemmatimonadota bacterium]